jgi:predicted dehydrogenase
VANRRLLFCADVDIVIVATTNNALAEVTQAAIEVGKHVLVEKPAARNTRELEAVIDMARQAAVQVLVGFNHRYHPALLRARELFKAGALVKCVRGDGGTRRIGYDKRGRNDPVLRRWQAIDQECI